MKKWQPVRMNAADKVLELHGDCDIIDADLSRLHEGVIVRVRPIKNKPPCNAKRGFEVHPDDVHKISDGAHWLCEHQILAD